MELVKINATIPNSRQSELNGTMAAPPPQTFPYDHLFKILIIGDAGVGKVCDCHLCFSSPCTHLQQFALLTRGRIVAVLDVAPIYR